MKEVTLYELSSLESDHVNNLSKLLKKVVDDGAAMGFLPPVEISAANEYWQTLLNPDIILWVAKIEGVIVGSVQLHLSSKKNGLHRAEIAKFMTHPDFRRMGIGRKLMDAAEDRAQQEGRSLIVLDTRDGDPSNHFYRSLGYIEAGRIPNYAKSANGEFHSTVIYYKNI